MSMDYYQMAIQADNRRRALLGEAEYQRLVHQAHQAAESGHRHNLSGTALYRLGTLLTRWGDSLQARYDTAQIEPAPLLNEG